MSATIAVGLNLTMAAFWTVRAVCHFRAQRRSVAAFLAACAVAHLALAAYRWAS